MQEPAGAGRAWYSVEGMIFERHGGRDVDGHPLASAAWLSILNPDPAREVQAVLRVYHERREPTEQPYTVPASRVLRLPLHELPVVGPYNQQFALGVFADRPVFPQHTWADYRPLRPIPEDMESITLYQGPLGDAHRRWIFPDMYQGVDDDRAWYEKEVLSLLNPGDLDAQVTITFYEGYWRGAPSPLPSPHPRPAQVTVPARRVLGIRLYDYVEVPRYGGGMVRPGGSHRFNMQRALRLECTAPIVPQKTRRCQVQFDDTIIGEWTSIGLAAGSEGGA